MARKRSNDEYLNELKENYPDFECLEEYHGSKNKILHRHKVCGYTWMVKPNILMNNTHGCPLCSGKVRKDSNYFKQEVFNLVANEYEVISEYVNTHTKIKFKHNCGNIFDMTPHNFLAGQRCPMCQHRSWARTTDEFKKEIFDSVGDEYELKSEYSTVKTKVSILHKTCNHVYEVTPGDFLQGYRCPYCYGNIKKTQDEVEADVYRVHGGEYSVIGKYINYGTRIKVRHNVCGHEWNVLLGCLIGKQSGCPKCKQSKGEIEISRVLANLNIDFEVQKKFDDLRGNRNVPLSYDFYIKGQNTLIEYQGQQHYYPVDWFGGEEKFYNQKKIDSAKRKYAKDHNMYLLEIPYTDFDNIEDILRSRLLKQSA